MSTIDPCIWFDKDPEEAVNLYTSLIPNSKIKETTRYDENSAKAAGMPKDAVLTISFQLDGQDFLALNGGAADFIGNGAGRISLIINCETQAEVDKYWDALTEGGKEIQCGWLTDKYGVTWQVIPTILGKLLSDPDKAKAQRVMTAMLKMVKINIAELEAAGK